MNYLLPASLLAAGVGFLCLSAYAWMDFVRHDKAGEYATAWLCIVAGYLSIPLGAGFIGVAVTMLWEIAAQ